MRLLLAVVTSALVGCAPALSNPGSAPSSGNGPATAAASPAPSRATLSGSVTEVNRDANRFLLGTETGPVWVIVNEQTVFESIAGPIRGTAPLATLHVGEPLSVGYSGAMMKSMPPQAVAERVIRIAS
jgi:hypothetical protein